MIIRNLHSVLKAAAASYPVVTLTGPRQSGKTTLVKAAFADYAYASLEEMDQRSFAIEDPRGFLDQFQDRVILDEVQHTPDLFSYIQTRADNQAIPGQYILTGSQNFLLLRSVSQTLAGRCSIHHLLPFSMDELAAWPPLAIDRVGTDIPQSRQMPERDILEWMFTGFYPRIHDKALSPQDWLGNYVRTYLERDVRDIVNVGDLETFRRFMALCAGRNGQILNLSNLASDCGITHTTARRWLSVLETSFIVILLRPHHKNYNKRLIKSPKLYFLDTGLLCRLLRIRSSEELHLHAARGAIFEAFVVSELYKRLLNRGKEPDLFFWRDSAGHEVDLIIDMAGRAVPVEIKAGKTVANDFFKGLEYYAGLTGQRTHPAALIHAGDRSYFRKGIAVYSWWQF